MRRREVLLSSTALLALTVPGCLADDDDGPETVAEQFLIALDDGDDDRLDELSHPDGELDIPDDERSFYEFADLQIQSTSLVEEDGDEAIVDASITIETDDGELTDDPEIALRSQDGSWLVYDWDGGIAGY